VTWHGRRAALVFIFVTVLLDMLALGLIMPVLPPLVVTFVGGDTARAAELYGLAFTLFAAMQFVASPVLGALSDRPAVERRARPRLHRHGARAERRLAPGWARVVRAHLREHHGRGCLRRRRHRGARAAFGLGFVLGPALGGLLGS